MKEIWKAIDGYEGIYRVSNMGRILNAKTNKILKPYFDKKGYGHINLSKSGKTKSFQVYRLVAFAFIPNPNNYPIINHKDENPRNNSIENLEWCTYKYNCCYGKAKEKYKESCRINNSHIEAIKTRNKRKRKTAERPVVCLSKDGDIIGKYMSIADAYRKTSINNIGFACRGIYKSAGGYYWKYIN